MSEKTITLDDLSEAIAPLRRENLRIQTMVSAMIRLCEHSGEMDGDDLAALALELEVLLDVVHDQLAANAGRLANLDLERPPA